MKKDTPRTNAVLNTFDGKASKLAADLATHAEELERELTAVTEQRDEARGQLALTEKNLKISMQQTKQAVQDRADEHVVLIQQRDEARGQANDMREKWLAKGLCCEHLGAELHEAINQRDEARAEMIRWMSIAEGRGRTDDEEENDQANPPATHPSL